MSYILQVPFAAGRDLRPGQLGNMLHTLSDWYFLLPLVSIYTDTHNDVRII